MTYDPASPSVSSQASFDRFDDSPLSSPSIQSASFSPDTSPDSSVHGDNEPFSLENGARRTFLRNSRKHVMVVGGLGYIGSHTTLELLKEGYNVIVVDDLSNSFEGVVETVRKLATEHCRQRNLQVPVLKLHQFDYKSVWMRHLLSRYAVKADDGAEPRSRISGVIHFAAFKSVEESISKPLAYYQNNICGLVDLLVLLQEFGIKNFVFSSSATVYGTRANAGKPLKENDLVHFPEIIAGDDGSETELVPGATGITSPYGRTKYFAEAILADVAKADPTMRITALRYFNPVGCHPSGILREDPRQVPTNLFPVIAQVLTGARPVLNVFGSDWETRDGTAIRDFIHVMDLARGHIAAMAVASSSKYTQSFRSYNLGTGNGTTVAEAVSHFEKASGVKLPVNMAGRRAGDVGSCVAETERAEMELGWKTELSMEECARDCWNALQVAASEQA